MSECVCEREREREETLHADLHYIDLYYVDLYYIEICIGRV